MKYKPSLPKSGWYVYGLFIDGVPFYIGKGSGYRATNHFSNSYMKSNPWKASIIRKHRNNIEVIILTTHTVEYDALKSESFLIESYGLRSQGGLLVNLTMGGGGTSGVVVSSETKMKRGNSIRRFSKEAFGKALVDYYINGKSQTDIAADLNVHQTSFSSALKGKTKTLISVLDDFKRSNKHIDFETFSSGKWGANT